jgi:hypothetical protein
LIEEHKTITPIEHALARFGGKLTILLGAGVSASAGIPLAAEITSHIKREHFAMRHRIDLGVVDGREATAYMRRERGLPKPFHYPQAVAWRCPTPDIRTDYLAQFFANKQPTQGEFPARVRDGS